MGLSTKVSGTWKDPSPKVKIAGTWTQVQFVFVKVSGVWKQIWANMNAAITGQTVLGTSDGRYRLNSSGIAEGYTGSYSTLETWLLAGANSDFECRATFVSGDALTSGTTGSWLALSSSREWARTASFPTFRSSTITVEIRRVSDSVVVTSANITIEADNT